MFTDEEILAEARKRIDEALPEDEPDCIPSWVIMLLVDLGREVGNLERIGVIG